MKYFQLTREDGVYWRTPKISKLLIDLGLVEIDRTLRTCYETKSPVKYKGHWYYLERYTVDNFDDIEFGQFGDEKVIRRDYSVKDDIEIEDLEKEELVELLIKTKKQLQKREDTLRIERKAWRLENRKSNVIEDTLDELVSKVEKFKPSKTVKDIKLGCIEEGIIQLSDLHIGEVVDLQLNTFNYEIARSRLIKLFSEAIKDFNQKGITCVNILMTGDLINMSKHMDKILTNEATRSESLNKAFQMLSECIDWLLQEGFKVKLAGVVGNEGRVETQYDFSNVDAVARDNFDYILYLLIKARYFDASQVEFINNCDRIEDMVCVNGKYIILVHGNNINHNKLSSEIVTVKIRWFKRNGIYADFVMLGHIHSHRIEPTFARSGSLPGANGFSDTKLNIPDSVASQNIGAISDQIKITSIVL